MYARKQTLLLCVLCDSNSWVFFRWKEAESLNLAVVSVTPIMRMRRMACFKPSKWVAVLKGQPALKDL
jgi:hypothetical protein